MTLGVGVGVIVITLVYSHFFRDGCSYLEKKPIRIEVDGKYGIGYDKDNMLGPAVDEFIDEDNSGNHWKIYNPKDNLKGLAYVTDLPYENIINLNYGLFVGLRNNC